MLIPVAVALLQFKLIEPTRYEQTILDLFRKRQTSATASVRRAPVESQQRLFVRMQSGVVKQLPLHEFLRHETQGKPVNHFQVSEDGQSWSTFGAWRSGRGA